MGASNDPQRVRDLVHRFGWDAIVRLAALGIQNLAEAQVFYVDSGASNASDVDDGVHGLTIDTPLATIDYAIGLCTASEQSVILVAPGHNETLNATVITFDIAGVKCIGMGHGTLTPRVDFDSNDASVDIAANNVYIENINFLPAVTGISIGVHVESNNTNFEMRNCEFMIGEDGSGTDEFVKAIELTTGNHDCIFENVKILAHASAANATHGIHVAAASDRLTFKNVIIDGPYATGGIVEAATGVNHVVEDCSIDVSGTNYSFDGSSTFAKYARNVDAGVTEDTIDPLTDVAAGSDVYPTGITNDSIMAKMLSSGDPANVSSFDNTTDSLEAISDYVQNVASPTDVTGAVSQTPTARSLQDILEKDASGNFDDSTDSLEAIADSLITAISGVSPAAGSALDILEKLYYGADGTDAYPATVANDSTLAKIMGKGDPASVSSYDNTTDSLEAISEAVSAISFTSAVSQTPTTRSLQDILEKDNTGSFDDSTDSLEAIADRLIDANLLELTSQADGGGNPYPDSVAQESVIAYLMSKSTNPVTTSYSNQTDSLEAIRDNLDDGTGILAGINLDHLCKTAVANGDDMTSEVADGSILSNILDDDGDTSLYDRTKHSLFAIGSDTDTIITNIATAQSDLDTLTGADGVNLLSATQTQVDNIEADVQKFDEAALSGTPTANSLATFIATGGTSLGQPLPASRSLFDLIGNFTGPYNGGAYDDNIFDCLKKMSTFVADGDGDFGTGQALPSDTSLVDIIGDFTGPYGGAAQDDNIKASLDLAHTDLDTIITTTDMGRQCTKASAVSLAGGDVNVFTVATGPVKITGLFFIVNTAVDAACKAGFTATPTAGSETDLTPIDASGVELNAAADAGDVVYSELDNTVMIVANTDGGAMPKVPDYWQIVPIGSINLALQNNDPTVGEADIYVQWEPLASGATVTAT